MEDKLVTIKQKDLQTLIEYFYEVCGLCDEMDIYEFEEGDHSMSEMKCWVDDNFGRDISYL